MGVFEDGKWITTTEKILLGSNILRLLDAGCPNDPGLIGPRRQLYVANKYGALRLI